jgi:hypothetical protein
MSGFSSVQTLRQLQRRDAEHHRPEGDHLADVGPEQRTDIACEEHRLDRLDEVSGRAEYCDRIALIAAGRVIAMGTPDELKASVRDPGLPDPTMEDAFIALLERRAA